MNHSECRFAGVGERAIYYQYWVPETPPQAMLLVVHGLGEHSARYQQLARYFVEQDYIVAALDLNGHGHSEGIPGFVESFSDYVDDLRRFHDLMAERFPEIPVQLLGHSMGGLVSCCYLLEAQHRFVGAMLSGAAIITAQQPGAIGMGFVQLLSRLTPRLGLTRLEPGGVSRDPAVVRQYTDDPFVYHGALSARLLREFFGCMESVQARAAEIQLPLLIMHGSEDVMVAPESAYMLYDRAHSEDKTLKVYPGLFHEIFNEPEKEQVLRDTLTWSQQHLQPCRVAREPVLHDF